MVSFSFKLILADEVNRAHRKKNAQGHSNMVRVHHLQSGQAGAAFQDDHQQQ